MPKGNRKSDGMITNVPVKWLDLRELSPDAPRATGRGDRCVSRSSIRPECRCVLRVGHAREGFVYCQFDVNDPGQGL